MATRAESAVPPPRRFPLTPERGVLALILAGAAVLHGSALRLPFFADDYLFLDQVRHRSLWSVLAAPDPIGNFFRPFGRQFYFWTLGRLTAQNAFAFHAVNLGLFLAILALLFELARRLAGLRVAAIATSILALSYTVDVPLRWVSGSQDLIAVAGALLALWLLARGRGAWAAVSLVLALLSKETVVLTPLVGIPLVRKPGEPWLASVRRAWPLFAATAVWAVIYVAMSSRHRGTIEAGKDPALVLAALVHLIQVIVGAEWRKDAPTRFLHLDLPGVLLTLSTLIVAGAAIGSAWGGRAARRTKPEARPRKGKSRERSGSPPAPPAAEPIGLALWTGVGWALAGALPVAAVASIWSAYFYLFAMCGVAIALGALASRLPRSSAVALVALLAWGSENGRQLDEFQTGPAAWSVESHVNRFYLDRAMTRIKLYLGELKASYPKLAPRTTIFWSGVPSFLAWQVADGPLVRWAYNDSSLRSYFLSSGFTLERADRGPVHFLQITADTIRDLATSPRYYKEMTIAMVLAGKYDAALAALKLDERRDPRDVITKYWLAVIRMANGDTSGVSQLMLEAQLNPSRGPAPGLALARARLAARDTVAARNLALKAVGGYALDPEAHSLLADVLIGDVAQNASCVMEALAHTALAPNEPLAWRRWAYIQTVSRRYLEAYTSIQRYFALGGAAAEADTAAQSWRRELQRLQPGGEYIQKGLRTRPLGH